MPDSAPVPSRPVQTFARVKTADSDSDALECAVIRPEDPCTIVIFGATGDLTARKLMPALYNLFQGDDLPKPITIVGCGRTRLDDSEFRQAMRSALESAGPLQETDWANFADLLHYQPVDYSERRSFDQLAQTLQRLDEQHATRGNRIFYIALPPSLYETVARQIGQSGLASEEQNRSGWSRIVVEKPFGTDLPTAMHLDRGLHEYFREHQIFRIDHYLAKETVQNILMFRFANSIFEPVWNRRYIDHVAITATETLGVEHRAAYYERAGVIRDMFQNHMMQLLALTAMEPPSRFEADFVQDEKVKVFRALRPFPVDNLENYLVLGQYARGTVDGQAVAGYREEPGVRPDSLTPTYASMKIFLDNWRWQGVPFYLTSGKRLGQKLTRIAIQFKQVPHSMFRRTLEQDISANRLILGIYPEERITLTFQTKSPGAPVCLRAVTMDFNYHQNYRGPVLDAYEKVLIDCMLGDHMLFWRQDGIEQCWAFLTPILTACETCSGRAEMLHFYDAGGPGPQTSQKLRQ
jgi:glucose-6-phosphate 1-dehydrogenase